MKFCHDVPKIEIILIYFCDFLLIDKKCTLHFETIIYFSANFFIANILIESFISSFFFAFIKI